MEIDDIEGCRAKKEKQLSIKTREVNKVDDIEGAKAQLRHKGRDKSPDYSAYDYSDITKTQFIS